MKKWTKPEMSVETFELTQTIATGCSYKPEAGQALTETCLHPQKHTPYKDGSAHLSVTKYLEDSNGDGKISQSEWNAAIAELDRAYDNAGEGHKTTHSVGVVFNGGPIPGGMFSS